MDAAHVGSVQANPPATRQRFTLPNLAWVAAAVCAFAPLAGALSRAVHGQLSGSALTGALAIAAAFVALPTAVAWLTWRYGGYGPRLPAVAFSVALGALAAGLIWRAVRETLERDAVVKSQAQVLAAQLVDRAGGAAPVASSPSANSRSDGRESPAVSPVAQPIVDAQRAVKARLDAVQLAYDLAADAVAPASFFQLARLDSAAAIAARREAVQAFARANTLVHEAAALGAFYFSSELRDRAVPEDAVREAVAIYRTATKNHLPRLKRLRDTDGAMALLMLEFLDFADAQRGTWRASERGDAMLFDDRDAQIRYEGILRVAKVLETDRERLRVELGAGR